MREYNVMIILLKHQKQICWHNFISYIFCLILFLCTTLQTLAHETKPAIAEIVFKNKNDFELNISCNIELILDKILHQEHQRHHEDKNTEFYNELRKLSPDDLNSEFVNVSKKFFSRAHLKENGIPLKLKIINVHIPAPGNLSLIRVSRISLKGSLTENAKSLTWSWSKELGDSVIRLKKPHTSSGKIKLIYSAYLRNGKESESMLHFGSNQ